MREAPRVSALVRKSKGQLGSGAPVFDLGREECRESGIPWEEWICFIRNGKSVFKEKVCDNICL